MPRPPRLDPLEPSRRESLESQHVVRTCGPEICSPIDLFSGLYAASGLNRPTAGASES